MKGSGISQSMILSGNIGYTISLDLSDLLARISDFSVEVVSEQEQFR